MKTTPKERDRVERALRECIRAENFHPFAGIGIASLMNYLVRHERMDVFFCGAPVRQTEGLITGGNFAVGIFRSDRLLGRAEGQDFYEVFTLAAAQALGVIERAEIQRRVPAQD